MIAKGQNIDSIYVNLYTDSLKKGTYNYINIDGKLINGKYIPLDSTHLQFTTNEGFFSGNNLWLEPTTKAQKVTITVTVRKKPQLVKTFDVWIKQINNSGGLKTNVEVLKPAASKPTKKKRKSWF